MKYYYLDNLEVRHLLNILIQIPSNYTVEVGSNDTFYESTSLVDIIIDDKEKKVIFYQGC